METKQAPGINIISVIPLCMIRETLLSLLSEKQHQCISRDGQNSSFGVMLAAVVRVGSETLQSSNPIWHSNWKLGLAQAALWAAVVIKWVKTIKKLFPHSWSPNWICLRDAEWLHFSLSVSNALVLRPSEQYWELEALGTLKVPSSVSGCISFPARKSSPNSAVIPRDTFVCLAWNKPLALICFQWG